MLAMLLDEQISPVVARELAARRPRLLVQSVRRWREGALLGVDDALVLRAATEDSLTLVTYDLRTIPPLLIEWGAAGRAHGGVIFVDQRTIRSAAIGQLVRALEQLWDQERDRDWRDRIVFLEAP